MAWTTKRQPIGPNRSALLTGLASDGSGTSVPVAVNPNTGEVLVSTNGAGITANLHTGQKVLNTTAAQVSSNSNSLANGVVLKSLSTNGANVYVGLSGVTTSNGDVLEPGESRGYAINNTNLLYIISPTSTTDIVTFSAN